MRPAIRAPARCLAARRPNLHERGKSAIRVAQVQRPGDLTLGHARTCRNAIDQGGSLDGIGADHGNDAGVPLSKVRAPPAAPRMTPIAPP